MLSKRCIFYLVFSFLISLYLSYNVTRLIFFHDELLVDTRNAENNILKVSYYKHNGTIKSFKKIFDNTYAVKLNKLLDREALLQISVNCTSKQIESASLNQVSISKEDIVCIDDLLSHRDYFFYGFTVIRLTNDSKGKNVFFIGFSVLLLFIFYYAFRFWIQDTNLTFKDLGGLITYSPRIFQFVSRKDIWISLSIFPVTFFICTGGDAVPVQRMVQLFVNGIDIYQFQVNHKAFLNFEMLNFPYNPLMLFFWAFFEKTSTFFFKNAPLVFGYSFMQIAIYKLVNLLLLIGTVLSILSFLVEKKIVTSNIRLIYYLSLLNPISFYVTIIFVQFDTVPLYFVTLGILHLTAFNKTGFLGVFMLSCGILMKLQTLVQFPVCFVLLVYIICFIQPNSLLIKIQQLGASFMVMSIIAFFFFFIHYHDGTAFYHLITNFVQKDRIWLTVYAFCPSLVIYILHFCVFGYFIFYLFQFHSKMTMEQLVAMTFLSSTVLIFLFCATHIYTPSTLIQVVAGFTILFALTNDNLKRCVLCFLSIFIVLPWMTNSIGDVSRVWFRKIHFFSDIVIKLTGPDLIKYDSLFFTISVATMVAYAIYFIIQIVQISKESSVVCSKNMSKNMYGSDANKNGNV